MSTLLTPAEFREYIDTSLADTTLQRLIDGAELDITAQCGPLGSLEDRRRGGARHIFLSRPAATIISVVERYGDPLGLADLPLDTTDWTLLPNRLILRREWVGTHRNDRWAEETIITYTPVDDTATRQRAVVNLIKLEIAYQPGLTAQSIGAWMEQYRNVNYADERAQIFQSLQQSVPWFA